jgi:hypothetical protein
MSDGLDLGDTHDWSKQGCFSDPSSQERLARHAARDRVEHSAFMPGAVGTGVFAGLQYLTGCIRRLSPRCGRPWRA